MRGRLRCVFDADHLLGLQKSTKEPGGLEGPVVVDYGLPDGKEFPDYEGKFLSFCCLYLACIRSLEEV